MCPMSRTRDNLVLLNRRMNGVSLCVQASLSAPKLSQDEVISGGN